MRAQPSTQFELSLGSVIDAPVGRLKICEQLAQILKTKNLMRAQPSTQFELSLGSVIDAPVGRLKTCVQLAQILKTKILKVVIRAKGTEKAQCHAVFRCSEYNETDGQPPLIGRIRSRSKAGGQAHFSRQTYLRSGIAHSESSVCRRKN